MTPFLRNRAHQTLTSFCRIGAHQTLTLPSLLIFHFPAFKTVKNIFLLINHTVSGILLQ